MDHRRNARSCRIGLTVDADHAVKGPGRYLTAGRNQVKIRLEGVEGLQSGTPVGRPGLQWPFNPLRPSRFLW